MVTFLPRKGPFPLPGQLLMFPQAVMWQYCSCPLSPSHLHGNEWISVYTTTAKVYAH